MGEGVFCGGSWWLFVTSKLCGVNDTIIIFVLYCIVLFCIVLLWCVLSRSKAVERVRGDLERCLGGFFGCLFHPFSPFPTQALSTLIELSEGDLRKAITTLQTSARVAMATIVANEDMLEIAGVGGGVVWRGVVWCGVVWCGVV